MTRKIPRAHRVTKEGSQYRVIGVPIFAEHTRTFSCPKTGKNFKVKVDRERLGKFAENGNKRAKQDDYLAAIHPVHNGDGNANEPACGLMENYRVETFEFEGKPQAVLVVDLIARDKGELETIKRHPYRSPEANLEKNEIGTLALLERQAPFFKFPLFKTKDDAAVYRCENTNQPEAAGVAFAAYADATQYAPLYQWDLNYREAGVKSDDKPKGDKASCKGKGAKKPEEKEESGVLKRLEAMEGYMQRFGKFMDELEAEDDDEDPKGKKEDKEPAALLSEDRLENYADQADLIAATAERVDELTSALYRMEGIVAGLQSENTNLKSRNEKTDLVNWAMAETDGLVRPANFTDRISAIYSDSGPKAVRSFVEGIALGAPEREDYSEAGDDGVTGESLPDCVAQYSDDPAKLARAKKAYQQYHSFGDKASQLGSVEDYVDLEFTSYRN